jgi:uncharacterized membrane protein YozB (DUF420 family)
MNQSGRRPAESAHDSEGLYSWVQLLAFIASSAILILRTPDAILHPQFFAEDGHDWFADAYNRGWLHALFLPYAGYLVTLQRLAGSFSLSVSLQHAPLLLNASGILFAALPVNILLHRRSASWGSLRFRALLAALYLALPNTWELGHGVTNAQWVLALSALLILAATPAVSRLGQLSDAVLLALCGLTGPFGFLLLPPALYRLRRVGDHRRWMHAAPLLAACCLQLIAIGTTLSTARAHPALGATPGLFIRLLAGNVYLAALLGTNVLGSIPGTRSLLVLACVAAAGTAVLAVCVFKAPAPLRNLIGFSAVIFALALLFPFNAHGFPLRAWQALVRAPGAHYWFFPTLAFTWSVAWLASRHQQLSRIAGVTLLCLMCVGILRDWRRPALVDEHFSAAAERFRESPPGTAVTIPLNPPGWEMRLVKH